MTVPLILEVAISMVFLYLLGSQVVLSIYELWAGYTNSRGKFLYRNLKGTIGEVTTQELYAQGPIAALTPATQAPPKTQLTKPANDGQLAGKQTASMKSYLGIDSENAVYWFLGKDGLPAYIPTDLFASTLLAMVAPDASTQTELTSSLMKADNTISKKDEVTSATDIDNAKDKARIAGVALDEARDKDEEAKANSSLTTEALKEAGQKVEKAEIALNEANYKVETLKWYNYKAAALLTKILNGLPPEATLAECQKSVALWYDAYGERLTGWYKRRVRLWLFLIGLVVAFVGNIDSPFIIRYLWGHPQLSQQLADAGAKEAQAAGAATTYAKPGASFTKRAAADTANNKAARAITLSAEAELDSLAAKLRASEDRVNALNSRLHVLGFPIGRTDSASLDSSLLPSPFFVRQPGRVVQQGKVAEAIPAYYLCYERHEDPPASASVKGIKSQKVYWVKEPLPIGNVTEAQLRGPHDRSQASAWYEPVFGPQSQSAGLTCLGWFLTAIALSLGSPFWFDLLCRLVNIRNLGIKPPRTGQ